MPPKKAKQFDAATKKRVAATPGIKLVTDLGPNDVLMGRGALATDYEGNLRLRGIVHQRLDEYITTQKRNRKHQIAEEIMLAVIARGGRFLQSAETLADLDPKALPQHAAAWFVVEDEKILLAKVKQLLRDVKPLKKNGEPRKGHNSESPNVFLASATTTTTTTTTSHANTTASTTSSRSGKSDPPSLTTHQHHQQTMLPPQNKPQAQHHVPPPPPPPQQQQHEQRRTQPTMDLNFLWQQLQPALMAAAAATATTATASSTQQQQQTNAPWTPAAAAVPPRGGHAMEKNEASPPLAAATPLPPTTISQPTAGISQFTSHLGQANASSLLQNLTQGASRDQQYDAILALSLASRLAPQNSSTPVSARRDTGPRPEARQNTNRKRELDRDLKAIATELILQNQRREREHALVNALLADLLPRILQDREAERKSSNPSSSNSSPSPSPAPQDPSMTWLFNQLQSNQDRTTEAARSTAGLSEAAPAPVDYGSLSSFLRSEQKNPRPTGLLEQPSRLAELERLLLPTSQWTQQSSQPNPVQAPASSATESVEDGLVKLLRAMQRQYFPRPPSP